jgi:hypothetical protein
MSQSSIANEIKGLLERFGVAKDRFTGGSLEARSQILEKCVKRRRTP